MVAEQRGNDKRVFHDYPSLSKPNCPNSCRLSRCRSSHLKGNQFLLFSTLDHHRESRDSAPGTSPAILAAIAAGGPNLPVPVAVSLPNDRAVLSITMPQGHARRLGTTYSRWGHRCGTEPQPESLF